MSLQKMVKTDVSSPKSTGKIKFPYILVLIFFSVQAVLFLGMDFKSVISKAMDEKGNDAKVESKRVLQDILGTVLNNESLPPIATDNNFTSIMIIGIDSRKVELEDGEFKTSKTETGYTTRHNDSIMQVVYDHRTGNIFMISIPRDTGIDIRMSCLKYSGAIHNLYDKGMRSKCPDKGIEVLKNGIETVTGIKVHYYVLISLTAFEDIIATVGEEKDGQTGIFVENPRTFSDLYPIDTGWQVVRFPKGQLFLTPHKALQYARTRQYTSDFDRAKRQQLVVQAVLNRVLSPDFLLDFSKIQELITVYNQKIIMYQPKDATELMSMLSFVQKVDTSKIYHMVIDNNFGGKGLEVYMNKQPHDRRGPYYMVPTAWKQCPENEFCEVKARIQEYIAQPELIPQ